MMDLSLQEKAIIDELLLESTRYHQHLCPRQVLGVRMGLAAGDLLGLDVPQTEKRMYTFIETDGCFLDGVAVSTGCRVGARTMRVFDFGKMAATFIDKQTGKAVRIYPNPTARQLCAQYATDATDRWHAYLLGYQEMPVEELFICRPVSLTVSLEKIISHSKLKVTCDKCGEEIFNEREIRVDGQTLCQSCAGQGYAVLVDQPSISPTA